MFDASAQDCGMGDRRPHRPDWRRFAARRPVRRSERLSRRHREAWSSEKTGRELTLSGDLKLSVFPWIALESGPGFARRCAGLRPGAVRLDPASAGRRASAAAAARQGRSRQRAARRRAHPADHRRERSQQLGGSRRERSRRRRPPTDARPTEAADGRGPARSATRRSCMENRQEKSRREVRDFNLKTGRLASGEPFDFATDFVLDQDRSLSAKVKVAANVTADLERNVHRLAEPKIDVTRFGRGLSRRRRAGARCARSRCEADIGAGAVLARWPDGEDDLERATGCRPPACRSRCSAKDCNVNLASQTLELDRTRCRCRRRAHHRQSHRRGDSRCAEAQGLAQARSAVAARVAAEARRRRAADDRSERAASS